MAKRPKAPGINPVSKGGGGDFLGGFFGPSANPNFGQDEQYGLDQQKIDTTSPYMEPTGWQKFFAPDASAAASAANAGVKIQQTLAQQDAARALQNELAVQAGRHTNAMQLAEFNKTAGIEGALRGQRMAGDLASDARISEDAIKQATELRQRENAGTEALYAAPEAFAGRGMIAPQFAGGVLDRLYGTQGKTTGTAVMPSWIASQNAANDAAGAASNRAFTQTGRLAAADSIMGAAPVIDELQTTQTLKQQGLANQLAIAKALNPYSADLAASTVGAARKGALADVGSEHTVMSLSPGSNWHAEGMDKAVVPTEIEIAPGVRIPGKPNVFFKPGSITGEFDNSPEAIRARVDADMEVARKQKAKVTAPSELLQPRVVSKPEPQQSAIDELGILGAAQQKGAAFNEAILNHFNDRYTLDAYKKFFFGGKPVSK